jgi:dTDP-4-dehydrorhamnose 3,5-epimerase
MDLITPSNTIQDVQLAHPKAYADSRGQFMEIFRREWFPQVDWSKMQSNHSISKTNVLRGLHYHFHQVDYWFVSHGCIRAGLVDLRPHSPTYKAALTLEMGADNNIGLFIPVGVAHGFYAVSDCTLIYFVNNYYNSQDEHGVAWNDPALGLDWQIGGQPLISERDINNPLLSEIPDNLVPTSQ